MRIDPDAVVASPPQRRMGIHRDRRVDDRAAVIVDEVVGEVGAAAGETDPHRRARPREHFALFAEAEQVAAEDVDQAAFGIENRHDMNALIEQLEDLLARPAGGAQTKLRLTQVATWSRIEMPASSFLRMSPSVTAPTTRPPASSANRMPSMLMLSRRNASSIVSVSAMVTRVRSSNFSGPKRADPASVEGIIATLGSIGPVAGS